MSDPGATATGLRAIRGQALSVGLATGSYGLSFGALAVTAGLSVPQAMALSLLLFSGGSQFAVVNVLGAGGSGAAAVATSAMLGVRNGLYGIEVARFLRASGARRLLGAHLTIDESTAVGLGQPTPTAMRAGFWWTGASVFVLWNLTTVVGALVGERMGDPTRWGLDAAAGAAFLALLWSRLHHARALVTAVAAVVLALAFSPVVPAGVPVLLSVVAALVVGLVRPDDPDDTPVEQRMGPGAPA